MAQSEVKVMVAYCAPGCEDLTELVLPPGATVQNAIDRSGVLERHGQLRQGTLDVGIWGRRCDLADPAADGDRIEIYRPLNIDPREARRVRAAVRKRRGRVA